MTEQRLRVLNIEGGVTTFPNAAQQGAVADFGILDEILTIFVDGEAVSWFPLRNVQGWWLM